MESTSEVLDRKLLIAAAVFTGALLYTIGSADCATGNHFGGCNVTSGAWANWIFTKVHTARDFFYMYLAGKPPFFG